MNKIELATLESDPRYIQLLEADGNMDQLWESLGYSIPLMQKAVNYIGWQVLNEVERTDECPSPLWDLYVNLHQAVPDLMDDAELHLLDKGECFQGHHAEPDQEVAQ